MMGFLFFYCENLAFTLCQRTKHLTGFLVPVLYVGICNWAFTYNADAQVQYTNTWHSQYMPFVNAPCRNLLPNNPHRVSSLNAFDNTGQPYNLTRIIGSNGGIDMEAYRNYSPVYLSCVLICPIRDDALIR